MKKILQKILPKKFGTFWKKIKRNKNLDKDLIFITNKFINSESYKYVSNQWHIYNIDHYKVLAKYKLSNLGTTIYGNYFNFFYYNDEFLKNLYKNISVDKIYKIKSNIFKRHKNLELNSSISYNYLLLLLFENLKNSSYLKFLKLLKDKTYLNFGNPFIKIDGINVTSDKIISLFDLENIEKFSKINGDRILEIGAGSGRTSECILSIKKCSNYTICDIPPAIYLSYKRLKLAFPNKKINLLIDIDDPFILNKKILESDISFIFPHQLEKINNKFYNMTIAIDCLHEMNKKTLKNYFDNISNISNKIYFSIWKETKNWYSGGILKKTERLHFDKGDYPVASNWKIKFKKELKFPSNYYGIGYNIK